MPVISNTSADYLFAIADFVACGSSFLVHLYIVIARYKIAREFGRTSTMLLAGAAFSAWYTVVYALVILGVVSPTENLGIAFHFRKIQPLVFGLWALYASRIFRDWLRWQQFRRN